MTCNDSAEFLDGQKGKGKVKAIKKRCSLAIDIHTNSGVEIQKAFKSITLTP